MMFRIATIASLLATLVNSAPASFNNDVLSNPGLFGGDIVGYHIKDPRTASFRKVLPTDIQLWANGIIPFVIAPDLESIRPLIFRAMNNYMESTCVKFVPRTVEYDYVNLTMISGCYSNVGRAGGEQKVSLVRGCHFMGIVVHELGHAVGFFHEHQRSDRDKYIRILDENVQPGLMDQFDENRPEDNRLLKSYDYNSIMHYGPTAFSRDAPNLITMKPKEEGVSIMEVYNKYGLSKSDIETVNKLYSC